MNDKDKLKDFAKEFGKTIRKSRVMAGLTQEELGQKIGSNRGAIIRIESGQAIYMPAKRALEICEVLNTSLTDIWREMNGSRNT